MKFKAVLLLCTVICSAAEATRPPCNAKNRGRFWPEEANHSGAAARQASRCGELFMCGVGPWKYRWEQLTVPYARLSGAAPAGCQVPEPPAARDTQPSAAVDE